MARTRLVDIIGCDIRSLAIFRMAISFTVFVDLWSRSGDLYDLYSDDGILPRDVLLQYFARKFHVSLYFIGGHWWMSGILFLVTAWLCVLVFVGHKTRASTIGLWFCVVSLHARNVLVLHNGDKLLRLLLFWSCFLPLGKAWSFDSMRRAPIIYNTQSTSDKKVSDTNWKAIPQQLSRGLVTPATIAVLGQVIVMYIFTAMLKNDPEWRQDFSSTWFALSLSTHVTPIGVLFRQSPVMLEYLTKAVLVFEFLGPALLFAPLPDRQHFSILRTLISFLFVGLNVGFGSCLRLGIFPLISSVAMIPFIPGWIWDTIFTTHALKGKVCLRTANPSIHDLRWCAWLSVYIPSSACVALQVVMTEDEQSGRGSLVWVEPRCDCHRSQPNSPTPIACIVKTECGVIVRALYRIAVILKMDLVLQLLLRILTPAVPNLVECTSQQRKTSRSRIRRVSNFVTHLVVAALALFTLQWNVGQIWPQWKLRYPYKLLGTSLWINQHWDMFAPHVPKDSGHFVFEASLQSGLHVDLFKELCSSGQGYGAGGYTLMEDIYQPSSDPPSPDFLANATRHLVTYQPPPWVSYTFKSLRWRKLLRGILRKKRAPYRKYLHRYLCREWHRRHPEREMRIEELSIFFFKRKNGPGYTQAKIPTRVKIVIGPCEDDSK